MAERDYEEFLELLNANRVRYLIAGAHAVAFHARPRATKDIDIYHDPSPANCERLLEAIKRFFSGSDMGFRLSDLSDPELIVQLGVAPVRIDLLSSIKGIASFNHAWKNRVQGNYGAVHAYYLSLKDTIQAKAATKRVQDEADLLHLRKARRARPRK